MNSEKRKKNYFFKKMLRDPIPFHDTVYHLSKTQDSSIPIASEAN